MAYPETPDEARLIVSFGDEVKLLGNKIAFAGMAEWMRWLSNCPDGDSWELHLQWHWNNGGGRKPPRVIFQDDCESSTREISFQVIGEEVMESLMLKKIS